MKVIAPLAVSGVAESSVPALFRDGRRLRSLVISAVSLVPVTVIVIGVVITPP